MSASICEICWYFPYHITSVLFRPGQMVALTCNGLTILTSALQAAALKNRPGALLAAAGAA